MRSYSKIVCTVATLMMISATISHSQELSDRAYLYVDSLLSDGAMQNSALIHVVSKNLTSDQRELLYKKHHDLPGVAFLLNLWLSFGIGSWIQGDQVGGLVGTVGMTTGMALIAGPFVYCLVQHCNHSIGAPITIGAILVLSTSVASLILPWVYGANYNAKLRDMLGLSDTSELNVVPQLRFLANGRLAPSVGVQLNF